MLADHSVSQIINFISNSRGAVVRALVCNQCASGSISGPGIICGLSSLLVLVLAPLVFLRVFRFSSLHKKLHFDRHSG